VVAAGVRITLDEELPVAADTPPDLVALDDALVALAKLDQRRSQVIELRFFGGLTVEEMAVVLRVAPDTVMPDPVGQGLVGARVVARCTT
jgi:DNA-directed RNA polymerase specialized sigma24 family protein